MECLTGYIGTRWCNGTEPPSGLYINDAAGISFKQLSGIANDEQKTAIGVWEEIEQRGIRRLKSAVYAALSKRYQLYGVRHSYNLNRQVDTSATVQPSVSGKGLCGFTIKQRSGINQGIESYLSSIYIQSLSFYANSVDETSQVEFMVYDLTTGIKIWTDTVTLVEGWNKIEVNEVFLQNSDASPFELFVCFDSTSIFTYEKELNVPLLYDLSLEFKGGDTTLESTDDVYADDVTAGDNSYGLTGIISSVCSWDALICNNKQAFANALLHAHSIEVDIETIYSERFNRYTTIGAQKAKDLLLYHTELFEKEIQEVCSGLYIDKSDACIDCNNVYQLTEVLP